MIKLMDLIPSRFKNKESEIFDIRDIVKPDVWVHSTYEKDLINSLLSGKDYIGKKEDINKFNVPDKGTFSMSINQHAPNFVKGRIFSGFEANPYLITTELEDDAFQPNWNRKNYDNLKDSNNVAVLKPEYRKSKNFKLWERIPIEDKKGNIIKYGYSPITKPI